MAGESNLVFIINELDKAASGKGNGNPADVLLTLLDNLGFTDNYMECMIPTVGVYPIATANDKDQISAPLMSRFAVIDIPDYTPEEKKMIRKRMILSKTSNMSVYLRKMAIDGMIVNTDTTYLKAMYQEMHKIGVNINQLAKVANTVGTATPQDIEELKEMVKKIWLTLRSFQSNLQ